MLITGSVAAKSQFNSNLEELMRTRAIAAVAASLILIASLPSVVGAQGNPPPAAQAIANPIGKVVSAKGAATVEHAAPVVVQASVGSGGQTKVGDLVYKGDVVSTGPDSAIGITFSDGTAFNLTSNARMA